MIAQEPVHTDDTPFANAAKVRDAYVEMNLGPVHMGVRITVWMV